MSDERRKSELAAIHVGRQRLAMAEDAYRELLWNTARVRSAKDLDDAGRQAVIERMRRLGFKRSEERAQPPGRKPSVPADRIAMVNKIEALLAERALPWSYAAAIAQRMFKVEHLEWLPAEQLHTLIGVLEIDHRRRVAAARKSDPAVALSNGLKPL